MAKRKVSVGDQSPGGVDDAPLSTVKLAQAEGSAAAAAIPGFTETEAILGQILQKVLAEIEALVGRLPEGVRPNTQQLNEIITNALANYRNRITGQVAVDLMNLVQTGRGPFKHDPAALA